MQLNTSSTESITVEPLDSIRVELLVGEEVLNLLEEEAFQAGWDGLYHSCPWATVFQSRAFVATWYKLYHTDYQPIVLIGTGSNGMAGLFTLARDRRGNITGAGASQAEYQVWLASAFDNSHFIKQALTELLRKFLHTEVHLKFVPGNTPITWAESDPGWKSSCFVRPVKQPLLVINKEHITSELKKKNRREKLNRLKRIGHLRFERISDSQQFSSIVDELAIQSDFRKGAMYNKTVFKDEPKRKDFLLNLFDLGLLHATVLWLNDTIIASNVGVTGRNWIHLQGINTHTPIHAKHSPGILHFLMLGNLLADEGLAVFDLTPGADPYKDSLATEHSYAYEMTIAPPSRILVRAAGFKFNEFLKRSLPKAGVQQKSIREIKLKASLLKETARTARSQGLILLIKALATRLTLSSGFKTYSIQKKEIQDTADFPINKDNLADLLLYEPRGSVTSKWEFLMEAMKKFEVGQHVYTWSNSGCLLACAWLSPTRLSQEIGLRNMIVPEGTAVLYDFYFHPKGKDKLPHFIEAVMVEACKENSEGIYFVSCLHKSVIAKALKDFEPTITELTMAIS
jgi:CelD/BcsL family acetyltransferase involved in cellulose biosynthesis